MKHLWSPDGGNEASTTRRSNANAPESLSTMDKNAVSMTMENSQLKKLLAEVKFVPMSNSMLRSWPKMKTGALFSPGKLKLGFYVKSRSNPNPVRLPDCSRAFHKLYFYCYLKYMCYYNVITLSI